MEIARRIVRSARCTRALGNRAAKCASSGGVTILLAIRSCQHHAPTRRRSKVGSPPKSEQSGGRKQAPPLFFSFSASKSSKEAIAPTFFLIDVFCLLLLPALCTFLSLNNDLSWSSDPGLTPFKSNPILPVRLRCRNSANDGSDGCRNLNQVSSNGSRAGRPLAAVEQRR